MIKVVSVINTLIRKTNILWFVFQGVRRPFLDTFTENIMETMMQIAAEILTVLVVPRRSARNPMSELPKGAVPKKTSA